jgi:predicted esterase
MSQGTGPHANQPVMTAGEPLESASAAMIMVHGRGASAEDILSLLPYLDAPGFAYLAPQAANSTWYPFSFLAPLDSNEPGLSSALELLNTLVDRVSLAGIPAEKTVLLGFSQGACLALEYAARHARRYGGVAALSGGLIGPDDTPRDYPGSLDSTAVFLGCSDIDMHIPKKRVLDSADILRGMGAQVTDRLYPGMGHTIVQDEIDAVRTIMVDVVQT